MSNSNFLPRALSITFGPHGGMSVKRLPKPRIRFVSADNRWYCNGSGYTGVGGTATRAYDAWLRGMQK